MSVDLSGITDDFECDEYGNEESEKISFRIGDPVTWTLYGIVHEHPWDFQMHGWGPFRVTKVVYTSATKFWMCSKNWNALDHKHQWRMMSERERWGHRQKILIADVRGKSIPRITPYMIQGSVPGEIRYKYWSGKWFKKVRDVALFQCEAVMRELDISHIKDTFHLRSGKR